MPSQSVWGGTQAESSSEASSAYEWGDRRFPGVWQAFIVLQCSASSSLMFRNTSYKFSAEKDQEFFFWWIKKDQEFHRSKIFVPISNTFIFELYDDLKNKTLGSWKLHRRNYRQCATNQEEWESERERCDAKLPHINWKGKWTQPLHSNSIKQKGEGETLISYKIQHSSNIWAFISRYRQTSWGGNISYWIMDHETILYFESYLF